MDVTAIIPARRNSKGVRFKNRQEINGKSLVEHAVTFAEMCEFDKILITTDDEYFFEKETTARYCQRRSPGLSEDETIISDVIVHYSKIDEWKDDFFVILEPTCFLRKVDHLDFLFKGDFIERGGTNFASFIKSPTVREKIWSFDDVSQAMTSGPDVWRRRQDYTAQYVLSGHYYGLLASMAQELHPALCNNNVHPVIIDEGAIDINTQDDLKVARALLRDVL